MSLLDLFRLDGKVALVTGAGRGLGQSMAAGLADAGADVIGLDVLPVDQTAALVQGFGQRFLGLTYDLRQASAGDIHTTIQQAADLMSRLDILVNNAGIIRRADALEFSEADWDDVIQINLKALFFLAQAAAGVMLARREPESKGKIINVASMLSFQGGVRVPAYTAAKSGVAGITRALANEWASKGINVNAIAPGYMATDNTAPLRADPARSQAILERIPAGRWGEPADLQGTVVFLASAAADYLHGAIIPVDGGWLTR